MAVFLHKLKSYGISDQKFGFIFSFLSNRQIQVVHKNIQLMLEFLKGPFVMLHLSYYILMTFLMMLSAMLLSMLMMLLSDLNVIKRLVCHNN